VDTANAKLNARRHSEFRIGHEKVPPHLLGNCVSSMATFAGYCCGVDPRSRGESGEDLLLNNFRRAPRPLPDEQMSIAVGKSGAVGTEGGSANNQAWWFNLRAGGAGESP